MMMLIFREFKGGVVLVSHDQNLLQSVCHQVALSQSTEILIVVIHNNNLKILKVDRSYLSVSLLCACYT